MLPRHQNNKPNQRKSKMHRRLPPLGGNSRLAPSCDQDPCQVPNGKDKNGVVVTFIVEPGGIYAANYFFNPQKPLFTADRISSFILRLVPQIEANGDSFLGSRQTRCFYKRCKLFIRLHPALLRLSAMISHYFTGMASCYASFALSAVIVAPCSVFLRCSLRNSLSNIAFSALLRTVNGFPSLSGTTSAGFTLATSSAIKPNFGVLVPSIL